MVLCLPIEEELFEKYDLAFKNKLVIHRRILREVHAKFIDILLSLDFIKVSLVHIKVLTWHSRAYVWKCIAIVIHLKIAFAHCCHLYALFGHCFF